MNTHLLYTLRRSLLLALIASLGVLIMGLAQPVHAATFSLLCTGSTKTMYSPALTNTPQSVRVSWTAEYTACTVTNHPQINGGTASGSTVRPNASCTSEQALSAVNETWTYHWDDPSGSTSIVHYTLATIVRANGTATITETGTVTGGTLLDAIGSSATQERVLPELDPFLCSTTGVRALSGSVTTDFTSLL